MKLKLFPGVVLLSIIAFTAKAQDPIDIFNISKTDFSSLTARSAAMGGAFTALGADGASASINPAGLGMYRVTDIGITGSVLVSKAASITSGKLGEYYSSTKRNAVPLNNITAMFNVHSDNRSPLRAVNIGFVYNQLQNYSYRQFTSGNYDQTSMMDMFALNLNGINPDDIREAKKDPMGVYRNSSTSLWGSMMAYNTGLLFVTENKPYRYSLSNDKEGTLFSGDEVYPELEYNNFGRKGDYAFSVGFNLIDRIYIGATLAYQDFQFSKFQRYTELANLEYNTGALNYFDYTQQLTQTGSGFSFKLGATAELFKGFKIAAAVHAPTLFKIKEEYYADMFSKFTSGSPLSIQSSTPYNLAEYNVSTPTVLLFGVSYVIGKTAIISLDYDRTYYGNMKVTKGLGMSGEQSLNREIANNYQTVNNYRAGIEFRFAGSGYLRGGYAYYSNPLKNESNSQNAWQNISGGIGFKSGSLYCDLTYVNMQSKTSPQYFFHQEYKDGYSISSEQTFTNKLTRHSILLSLGSKF